MDPITIAIATAIAGKATEALSEPAKQVVAQLVEKVRERFHGRPADEAALIAAQALPDSPEMIGSLAEALERAVADDPGFGVVVTELWRQTQQAQVTATAEEGGVVNSFQGEAEKVVQLRDVHGNINL